MKTLALLFLTALTITAAEVRVTLPALTDREKYGLQYAVDVHNANTNNVALTVASYQNLVLEPSLSNAVLVARSAAIESYAAQRDGIESAKADRKQAIAFIRETGSASKLSRILAIVNEP